jgi:hypothetical protein
MKRNARPRLFDAPAGFDDPVEMLLACHRRIEHHLEILERLQAHVAAKGVDVEASGAAQSVLRYFTQAGEAHNEDEEKDVFRSSRTASLPDRTRRISTSCASASKSTTCACARCG